MKKSQSKKFDYQIKNDENFIFKNEVIKTTNINILLNRVRQKNITETKKKLIFSISIIGFLSLISIIVFVN
jgi:hypothetical protein|tara:strand:+ start:351 stop:563 length:213 start_codon:yes stop_codon:yes gene_type:complete